MEQVELLNDQTEVNLKNLLEQMPVGVVQFDQETNEVEWFNPYSELIFTSEEGSLRQISFKRLSATNVKEMPVKPLSLMVTSILLISIRRLVFFTF